MTERITPNQALKDQITKLIHEPVYPFNQYGVAKDSFEQRAADILEIYDSGFYNLARDLVTLGLNDRNLHGGYSDTDWRAFIGNHEEIAEILGMDILTENG